jgi:hypothetical protein
MSPTLSLTESQTLAALRSFLLGVLPAGIEVIRGQGNRVPEPACPDFVVMTPGLRDRISTNVDSYSDAAFVGSIAGATMTITEVTLGALAVGSVLLGANIAAGTYVKALGTGTGGIGTYTISPSQTVAIQVIAAGVKLALQPANASVQLDVHGPSSSDNAHIISTLFRDDYGVQAFAASGFDVSPLYTSEPHQIPFTNGEQQYEERWVVDCYMQCNPVIVIPQQFASAIDIELKEVDVTPFP